MFLERWSRNQTNKFSWPQILLAAARTLGHATTPTAFTLDTDAALLLDESCKFLGRVPLPKVEEIPKRQDVRQ